MPDPATEPPSDCPATCSTCRHATPLIADDGEDLLLHCRRYPPTVLVYHSRISQTWPTMAEHDTCGEWGPT